MMNIKKFFVKSFVVVSAMSALLTTGISAYAKDDIDNINLTNFFTDTTTRDGDYSKMYCGTNTTRLTAKESNYYGSYKWVRFSVVDQSNGSLNVKASNEKTGCNASLTTDPIALTDDIVRRVHKAKLYRSSNDTSDIIDNYNIKIDK